MGITSLTYPKKHFLKNKLQYRDDVPTKKEGRDVRLLKELGHYISDHDAINSTAILFLPYKEAISLDYCQFTGLWVQ